MKQRLKKAIGSNSGELYLDSIMTIFVVFLCIAIALAVLPVIMQKQQLDMLAKEVARYAEVWGDTSSVQTEAARMGQQMGILPNTVTASPNRKIQLREEFTVTLTKKVDIGYSRGISIPLTLTSVATGRSEVYWK